MARTWAPPPEKTKKNEGEKKKNGAGERWLVTGCLLAWLEGGRAFSGAKARGQVCGPGRSEPVLEPGRGEVDQRVEVRFGEVVAVLGAGDERDDAQLALHVLLDLRQPEGRVQAFEVVIGPFKRST